MATAMEPATCIDLYRKVYDLRRTARDERGGKIGNLAVNLLKGLQRGLAPGKKNALYLFLGLMQERSYRLFLDVENLHPLLHQAIYAALGQKAASLLVKHQFSISPEVQWHIRGIFRR